MPRETLPPRRKTERSLGGPLLLTCFFPAHLLPHASLGGQAPPRAPLWMDYTHPESSEGRLGWKAYPQAPTTAAETLLVALKAGGWRLTWWCLVGLEICYSSGGRCKEKLRQRPGLPHRLGNLTNFRTAWLPIPAPRLQPFPISQGTTGCSF